MRHVLTALAVFAFIGACSSHYDLVTPAGQDAGTPDAAAPTTDGAAPATDDDASPIDASSDDGGLPEPPAIGSNCLVARNPVPLACQDFDNDSGELGPPSDGPHQINGTAVAGTGSNSTQGLVCSATAGYVGGGLQGAAYYDTQPADLSTQFVWSFDLLVNSSILVDTALTALDGLDNNGESCELDIVRSATGFSAVRACAAEPETLFELAVPAPAAGAWMSILIAIDLNASTFRFAVRPDATQAPLEASGTFAPLTPKSGEQITCGAWRTPGGDPNTVVAIDNLAVWWK